MSSKNCDTSVQSLIKKKFEKFEIFCYFFNFEHEDGTFGGQLTLIFNVPCTPVSTHKVRKMGPSVDPGVDFV